MGAGGENERQQTREFPPSVDAVRDARRWVEDILTSYPGVTDRVDDAVLVVAELVANAVLHADPGPITVRVAHIASGDTLVDVSDAGGGLPQLVVGPPNEGHLGLRLVDALADEWDVRTGRPGTTVSVRFHGRDSATSHK